MDLTKIECDVCRINHALSSLSSELHDMHASEAVTQRKDFFLAMDSICRHRCEYLLQDSIYVHSDRARQRCHSDI